MPYHGFQVTDTMEKFVLCAHFLLTKVSTCLGMDIRNIKREDAGRALADTLTQFMYDLKVDNGLNAVGYTKDDIPELVKGTLPQVKY